MTRHHLDKVCILRCFPLMTSKAVRMSLMSSTICGCGVFYIIRSNKWHQLVWKYVCIPLWKTQFVRNFCQFLNMLSMQIGLLHCPWIHVRNYNPWLCFRRRKSYRVIFVSLISSQVAIYTHYNFLTCMLWKSLLKCYYIIWHIFNCHIISTNEQGKDAR